MIQRTTCRSDLLSFTSLQRKRKSSSQRPEMQPRCLDRDLCPAFIRDPRALHPAPSSCPDTIRQAESPVKKRPFTVEFLLSKSPPKVGRRQPSVCHVPVYPEAGCGNYSIPGNYPVLYQGAGPSWPLYSAWNVYNPAWRAGLPVMTHSIPATDHKAKRFRAIFTQEQLAVLESEFKKHHYIIGPQRVALASALGLSVLQVKVWFQNRRIKWKKEVEKSQQVKTAAESESQGKNVGAAAEDVSTSERHPRDLSKN